jgi:hypothetical protein
MGLAKMWRSGAFTLAFTILATMCIAAQKEERFNARLSPMPLTLGMFATVAGTGSTSAVLSGNKVAITGSFEGLRSPATVAQIHQSRVRGVRGPAIFDLTVSKAASGTISGSFDLSDEQALALRSGTLYIQIDSEKAPDGNLWGWLLR